MDVLDVCFFTHGHSLCGLLGRQEALEWGKLVSEIL